MNAGIYKVSVPLFWGASDLSRMDGAMMLISEWLGSPPALTIKGLVFVNQMDQFFIKSEELRRAIQSQRNRNRGTVEFSFPEFFLQVRRDGILRATFFRKVSRYRMLQ